MVNRPQTDESDAVSIAIKALSFLASDPSRLGQFLAATGIGPADIRAAAQDPGFLAGVLDHLAEDETTMLAFAEDAKISPDRIVRARAKLSGPPFERDVP